MKFTRLAIPDLLLIEPRVFEDGRGFFYESYNQNVFFRNGVKDVFVQDNHSCSAKGVLRGLHYQIEPKLQAKLIRAVRGKILDVALDIRRESKTFGKHVAMVLDASQKNQLYVPAGFAHGFCALEEGTEILYKVSNLYSPEHERGILWNDPALGIQWPELGVAFTLSEKDKKNPTLAEALNGDLL